MNKKDIAKDKDMWPSTRIILNEALDRGISIEKLAPYLFLLKKGKHSELTHRVDNNYMGKACLKVVGNKEITKYFLQKAGVEYPKGKSFILLSSPLNNTL